MLKRIKPSFLGPCEFSLKTVLCLHSIGNSDMPSKLGFCFDHKSGSRNQDRPQHVTVPYPVDVQRWSQLSPRLRRYTLQQRQPELLVSAMAARITQNVKTLTSEQILNAFHLSGVNKTSHLCVNTLWCEQNIPLACEYALV